jgi:hypothetical protein
MRCVAVALPLSIVGVLILNSVAWACGDSERPGEMCGRDERGHPAFGGPPGSRWDRPGRDRGQWGRPDREKTERSESEDFEAKRREIQDWAEKEARKADAKMQEAIALKRNAETLQDYLSTKIAEEKNLTEVAIKREREAADRIKEAADKMKEAEAAKKAVDDQVKLLKADRERQESRFVELLAHDPCGAPAAGGAGTH